MITVRIIPAITTAVRSGFLHRGTGAAGWIIIVLLGVCCFVRPI